ncbi:MAG: VOC family protein [Acidobacteria bacterium]|nr:VOC family protein [Acidobacteriota bacterium]
MSESLIAVEKAVDHLLLGVPNLEEGIAWVEAKTGVKAVLGGRHPGLGTHNALLSLGQQQYLEIIAPDPTQTTLAPQFAFLQLATTPRLLTWAAKTNDIEALAAKAHAANFELDGPREGARSRPDGKLLRWKTLFIKSEFSLLIPFFIEWNPESLHPAEDSPIGCRLQGFALECPEPQNLRASLAKLGIAAQVYRSRESRPKAILATPRGEVVFD